MRELVEIEMEEQTLKERLRQLAKEKEDYFIATKFAGIEDGDFVEGTWGCSRCVFQYRKDCAHVGCDGGIIVVAPSIETWSTMMFYKKSINHHNFILPETVTIKKITKEEFDEEVADFLEYVESVKKEYCK